MSRPPILTSPSARWFGYSAYIRLSTRSSVDLPQPEGPMNALIEWSASDRLTLNSACTFP